MKNLIEKGKLDSMMSNSCTKKPNIIVVCPSHTKVNGTSLIIANVENGEIEITQVTTMECGLSLYEQATRIDLLTHFYFPKCILVDGNGVGSGLMDTLRGSFGFGEVNDKNIVSQGNKDVLCPMNKLRVKYYSAETAMRLVETNSIRINENEDNEPLKEMSLELYKQLENLSIVAGTNGKMAMQRKNDKIDIGLAECFMMLCLYAELESNKITTVKDDKDFNWEDFKNDKIAVHCDTRDKTTNFLEECEKRLFNWSGHVKPTSRDHYHVYESDTTYSNTNGTLGYCDKGYYASKGLKIIKWETIHKNERTLAEVINTIQNGETWAFGDLEIRKCGNQTNILIDSLGVFVTDEDKFTKKQKEYTFLEAMALIGEGKTVKSASIGCMYKLVEGKVSCKYGDEMEYGGTSIIRDEIEGKWIVVE